MRLTHDAEANAAYVYLVDHIDRGEVAFTRMADIPLDGASLSVDFDTSGRILGIEVLGVSRVLRDETITHAEDITRS